MKQNSKRIFTAFLSILLIFSMLSFNSYAELNEDELAEIVTEDPVEDAAEDSLSEDELIPEEDPGEAAPDFLPMDGSGKTVYVGTIGPYYPSEPELNAGFSVSEPEPVLTETLEYFAPQEIVSRDSAAQTFRNALIRRDETVTLLYSLGSVEGVTEDDIDNEFYYIINLACAHTMDEPSWGDYLHYNTRSFHARYQTGQQNGQYFFSITFDMEYYTTVEQEAAVDAAVDSILSMLALDGKSDLEKTKIIYQWLCDNIVYDNSLQTISHSSYAVFLNKVAVCQGYATAFYRLCLESGVEARYISSDDMNHAWDIVRLGDLYYYLDSTWDAGNRPSAYNYFLIGSTNWQPEHDLGEQFEDADFAARHIVSESDFNSGSFPTSGTCGAGGSNVAWSFDSDKKELTVTGSGYMRDYATAGGAPWAVFASQITTVRIGKGVKHIGSRAFAACTKVTTLYLESGLLSIGSNAFAALNDIQFNGCEGMANQVSISSPNTAIANAICHVTPHDYSTISDIKPDCTHSGCTRYSCVCGDYYDKNIVPALGHDFNGNYCSRCSQHIPTIRFSAAPSSLRIGRSGSYRVSVSYAPGNSQVIWSCSNGNVTLSPSGNSCTVNARSVGSSVITATLVNRDGTPIVDGGISVSTTVNITESSGGTSSIFSALFNLFNPLNIISRIFGLFR